MCLFVNYRSQTFRSQFLVIFRELLSFSMCAAFVSTYLTEVLCVWLYLQLRLNYFSFFLLAQQPPSPPNGPGPPHSRGFWNTHSDSPHSVVILWTSDQPIAETSTWQHTTLTTDKHPYHRWDSNRKSQQGRSRRPTPQTARPLGPVRLKYWNP